MLLRVPDIATIYLDDTQQILDADLLFDGGYVEYKLEAESLRIYLSSSKKGVRYLRLRWNEKMPSDVKVLGDAWERGYGDLQWNTIQPDRCMPWYMAASNGSDQNRDFTGRCTACFGVGVLPNSLAFWQYDTSGVTLWLDVRNGGAPTYLCETLECATVYFREYRNISAYEALQAFCKVMSPSPCLADHVVYGSNNWYYAYGNTSHANVLEDCHFVKKLCEDCAEIPYMVLDDGWEPNSVDAPWDRGNERFPDMKRLATEMKEIGVRPGIWVRYLINGRDGRPRWITTFPEEYYLPHNKNALDPSHPEVLRYVAQTTQRFINWGFELIKHDFSTYDIFEKWGFEFTDVMASDGWSFYDKTKTSAQIIKQFYQTIKDAAGSAVIVGCNVIGHLCAGIHHLNRTGDDTSGFEWKRTLKMGVNTLAFRSVQNNAFFSADADCVGITGKIDWHYNRKWLYALAHSGTPLFVSCEPSVPDALALEDLKLAFASGSCQKDSFIPIDWMETTIPERYLINGQEVTFDWNTILGTEWFDPVV